MNQDLIEYDEGEPVQTGVYACRVPLDRDATLYQDLFLTWHKSRWWHCGSDMPYRGHVPFFVGPLRRKMPRAAPYLDDLFR